MKKLNDKTKSAAHDLLAKVKKFAAGGYTQQEMAKALGLKSTMTLHSRLLEASQASGKPIPMLRVPRGAKGTGRVEVVEVKRRGKGDAFGVNVPQEPLARAGFSPGDRLAVTVRGKAIFLRAQGS